MKVNLLHTLLNHNQCFSRFEVYKQVVKVVNFNYAQSVDGVSEGMSEFKKYDSAYPDLQHAV